MYKALIFRVGFCLYACEEVAVLLPSHAKHKGREALGGNETTATVFHPRAKYTELHEIYSQRKKIVKAVFLQLYLVSFCIHLRAGMAVC